MISQMIENKKLNPKASSTRHTQNSSINSFCGAWTNCSSTITVATASATVTGATSTASGGKSI